MIVLLDSLLERLVHGWEVRTPQHLSEILEAMETVLANFGCEEQEWNRIRIALDEAITNGCKHGNGWNPEKKVLVTVLHCSLQDFQVRIVDEGLGFDPEDVPDPREIENLERPCGRGLLLMRHYMNVKFEPPGNSVILSRKEP